MISINISKKLIGGQGKFTLDISETINKGDFIGLYGKSGVGKTSLLRILSGLESPDKGSITLENKIWFNEAQSINVLVQQRNVGYVFQEDVLFPNMTVLQNLKFAMSKNQDVSLLEELIDIMELQELLNLNVQLLSGGQKQRISLARTLIRRPKILLLDEPFSALDFEMRQRLQNFIKKAHQKFNLTVIIVSHNPWELSKLTNIIWEINNGKVIKKGTPSQILPADLYG